MTNAKEFVIGAVETTDMNGKKVSEKDISMAKVLYQHQNKYEFEQSSSEGKYSK